MRRAMAAVVLGLLVAGCVEAMSHDDVRGADDGGADGAAIDATVDDAALDGSDAHAATDAADAADADASVVYGSLGDPTRWTTVALKSVNVPGVSWANAVFDGRYVHFGPQYSDTPVASYDTNAGPLGFDKADSWTVLPLPGPGAAVFGVAYAGATLFVTPVARKPDGDLLFWRHAGDPPDAGWQGLDMVPREPNAAHAFPGVDGRYLYLTPSFDRTSGNPSGVLARIDPTSMPDAAVEQVDLGTLVSTYARGFGDAVFDGRFLYFVPRTNDLGNSGFVVQYDTRGSFADAAAWSSVDVAAVVNSGLVKFGAGTFDGRYLYLATTADLSGPRARIARYDTTRPLKDNGSWAWLDLLGGTVDAGLLASLEGMTFDGRYVYVLGADAAQNDSAIIARVDTWAATFDTTAVEIIGVRDALKQNVLPGQLRFSGMAFDGQYVYFAPFDGALVARFEARTPRAPLTKGGGSVF